MARHSLIITIVFFFNTLIQLVSQIVVTRLFGARWDLEVFLAAVALPTIIVTVIYGTLNDAFLPLYGEQKIKDGQSAHRYFQIQLTALFLISLLVILVLNIFSNQISTLLYARRGQIFIEQVAFQMRYLFLSIPFSIVATIFGAHFYLQKQFNRFPFAQLVGTLVNLFMIIFLTPILGIFALVLGFTINIVVQIFFVLPPLKIFENFNWQLIKNFKFQTKNLLLAWIPLIIGNFALRSDVLLIRSFATNLPEGYFVYLNLVYRIITLASGIMTIGIQIVLLPHLVENFVEKNYALAIKRIRKAKIIAFAVSLMVVILIYLLAPFFIKLLFVGGKFTLSDAQLTISLLPLFLIVGIGWGVNGVFFQPLLALKKQWPLGILNLSALIAGWTISWFVYQTSGPLNAIIGGLVTLLFTGIIGSEILWQHYKKQLT